MRKDPEMTGPGINKDDFFRDLDGLGDVSDDAQTTGDLARLIRRTNTAPKKLRRPSTEPKENDIPPLKRHSSMVTTSTAKRSTSSTFQKQTETLMKRHAETSPTEPPKGRKKHRSQSVQIIPESAQIFKGLKFFFVPNNDISPARRLRIQRSQEYGASWAQTWSSDVTHVIVDKGLDYKEVLKVLTPGQLSVGVSPKCRHHLYSNSDNFIDQCGYSQSGLCFRLSGLQVHPPRHTAPVPGRWNTQDTAK